MRIRPVVVSMAAWTVGAVTAVGVGLIALSAIGAGLTDGPIHPLAPNAVVSSEQPAPPPQPDSTDATPPPARVTPTPAAGTAADRTVSSRGGTVVVRCQASTAYLVGWSPAPGFRAEDVVRGPVKTAAVTFVGKSSEVKVTINCANGLAQPTIREEGAADDDHTGLGLGSTDTWWSHV